MWKNSNFLISKNAKPFFLWKINFFEIRLENVYSIVLKNLIKMLKNTFPTIF